MIDNMSLGYLKDSMENQRTIPHSNTVLGYHIKYSEFEIPHWGSSNNN